MAIEIRNEAQRDEVMLWVSDLYKDVYGCRPRGYDWKAFSNADLEDFVNNLILLSDQQEADEKAKPVLCVLHNAEHIQRFADIALSLNQNDPKAHKMRRVRMVNEEAEV